MEIIRLCILCSYKLCVEILVHCLFIFFILFPESYYFWLEGEANKTSSLSEENVDKFNFLHYKKKSVATFIQIVKRQ